MMAVWCLAVPWSNPIIPHSREIQIIRDACRTILHRHSSVHLSWVRWKLSFSYLKPDRDVPLIEREESYKLETFCYHIKWFILGFGTHSNLIGANLWRQMENNIADSVLA